MTYLRNNSRQNLSEISKETNIPVSTLFCILKKLESTVINKHVSLIDFQRLGYGLRVHFALSSRQKGRLRDFLMRHKNVNSLHSLTNEYSFYVDCVFKDWKQLSEFKESLEQFEISRMNEIFVVEEIKKEGFSM